MKLTDWLETHGVKRGAFARRIGVSPALITRLCEEDQKWLSRTTAEAIIRETAGAVTPNDFVSPAAFRKTEGAAA